MKTVYKSEGMAFITDSAQKGPNGIIVVDLESGESWRRLHDHTSTKAEELQTFLPIVEGRPFLEHQQNGSVKQAADMGSDGIAISADGARLYYCPLGSRKLFSVDTDAIADRSLDDRDGEWETMAHDPRLLWPDTLSLAADGYLYVTANQLHRQARFHKGLDLRRKPYTLFRVRIDAQPVMLKSMK
jgi:sugar lactone lactonase YvrE